MSDEIYLDGKHTGLATQADVDALLAEVRRLRRQLAAVEEVVAHAQHPSLRQETLADDVDLIWRGRAQARKACAAHGEVMAELLDARRRAEQAEAKLARVRELHRPDGGAMSNDVNTRACGSCGDGYDVAWPCPTIRALDDDDGKE